MFEATLLIFLGGWYIKFESISTVLRFMLLNLVQLRYWKPKQPQILFSLSFHLLKKVCCILSCLPEVICSAFCTVLYRLYWLQFSWNKFLTHKYLALWWKDLHKSKVLYIKLVCFFNSFYLGIIILICCRSAWYYSNKLLLNTFSYGIEVCLFSH